MISRQLENAALPMDAWQSVIALLQFTTATVSFQRKSRK